jgi:hypothetical protein
MSQAGAAGATIGLALTGKSAAKAGIAETANAATAAIVNFFMISPFPSCRVRVELISVAPRLRTRLQTNLKSHTA